ncbi:MAG: Holliday junction resolvase RuvX [Balneolaceae bacterium]
MQSYSRLVGIDVGSKRIGIAQTDLLQTIATPVGTYPPNQVYIELEKIAQQSTIDAFIVGWPLTTSGELGKATHRVNSFIGELKKHFPDIDIIKVDERYTSNKAMEVMIKSGVPKKKRQQKERVDQIAAALILERYLEQNI